MQQIRTLLVDDDAGFRARVKKFLTVEPTIDIVGEAVDGREALCKTRELVPHLVLMDIRMPHMNGIDATYQIKQEMPEIKVLVLTLFDEEEYKEAVMKHGADAYVLKKDLFENLISTIKQLCM